MKLERFEILICVFEWCILNAQKVLSWNKFKKWNACKRWVFVRNPRTSKEMVHFVHEVHPVFAVTLSTFAHMLWGGQMMIPCQVSTFSEFICSAFQFQGYLAQNKSLNAWKIANEVRKGWNFSMWLWMLHVGCKKSLELK